MQILIIFILITSILAYRVENDVIVLESDSWEEAIEEHQYLFIYYYSPNNSKCMKFMTEYEEAAARMKNYDPKVTMAKISSKE